MNMEPMDKDEALRQTIKDLRVNEQSLIDVIDHIAAGGKSFYTIDKYHADLQDTRRLIQQLSEIIPVTPDTDKAPQ